MRPVLRVLLILGRIGETEKRQHPPVADLEKQVAILKIVVEDVIVLAPYRRQRPSQRAFVELPRCFEVAAHVRVVMQPRGDTVRFASVVLALIADHRAYLPRLSAGHMPLRTLEYFLARRTCL